MPKYLKHTLTQKINIRQVVSFFYITFGDNYYDPPEWHNFWELIYVDAGELTLRSGKDSFRLKKGDMYLHRPNEFHRITDFGKGKLSPRVFILSFTSKSEILYSVPQLNPSLSGESRTIIQNLISEIPDNPFNTAPIQVLPAIDSNLNRLDDDYEKNPKFASFQYIKLYMELLFINIIRNTSEKEKNPLFLSKTDFDNDMCERVTAYLKSNLYNSISIEKICRDLSYGKTIMCTGFKKNTGYSVMNFYNNLKISEAKILLKSGKYNITQISNLLCYSSPYYFSMQFKKITGMSPTEYKTLLR